MFSQKKLLLYFRKRNFLASSLKKIQERTFSARKIKKTDSKKILIFQEMELFCFIFFLYFEKRDFLAPRLIYFPKWNFLVPGFKSSYISLKKVFLIFQEELPKPQKPKFLILLQKTL